MMTTCDVAVVGLGPAGSMAALQLARAGVAVVGIERAQFPRYKVCGGCLNAKALNVLVRSGIDINLLGGVPTERFEGAFGARRVTLTLPRGQAVSRGRLDAFLANAAREAGASIHFGTKCTGVQRDGDGWSVHTGAETLRARMVIASEGLGGVLSKSNGRFATAVSPTARIGAGTILDFARDYARGAIYMAVGAIGYVGLTIVEDDRLNVAAALDAGAVRTCGSPALAARSILETCGMAVPAGFEASSWKGTPPLSQRTRPVAADKLFLLGDGAGYVEPFTGEGMTWALEGAVALSEILAISIRNGAVDGEREWNRVYRRRFGAAQRRCAWITAGLRSPAITATVAGVLGAVPALARPVIAELNAGAE